MAGHTRRPASPHRIQELKWHLIQTRKSLVAVVDVAALDSVAGLRSCAAETSKSHKPAAAIVETAARVAVAGCTRLACWFWTSAQLTAAAH